MHIQFIEANIGIELNEGNVYSVTGYSINDILGLTGTNGMLGNFHILEIHGHYPVLLISIDTDDFYVYRRIDFSRKTINNLNFYIHNKGNMQKGMGTLIFATQVENARMLGFEKIKVFAAGDSRTVAELNGYYTRGCFRF